MAMRAGLKFGLLMGAATVALAGGWAARAQDAASVPEAETVSTESVIVTGIRYRDRTTDTAPVLEYGLGYFQPFEPLTVGDMLKRTPSVAFLSDVTEYDGVRLRGLDPAYTQILINGQEVPGSGSGSGTFGNGVETSFFVDRIPAELVERIEIVRSQSANRSGDAVAGALNIVLRDGYTLDGGYLRVGTLFFENDSHWGETVSAVWGGDLGPGKLLLGANMQDRHNPKDKFSARYADPTSPLVDIEDQTDVRDGTDYSANASYVVPLGGGELRLDAFFVYTDRTENEDSVEFENPTGLFLSAQELRLNDNILTINNNNVDIEQVTFNINAGYEFKMLGGVTTLKAGYALFDNDEDEFEDETEFLRDAVPFPEADRFTRDLARLRLSDEEYTLKAEHEIALSEDAELEFGLRYQRKERDNFVAEDRTRFNLAGGTLVFGPSPDEALIPPPDPLAPLPGGDNTIERDRLDPYVMVSGEAGSWEWEAGLRYEHTDISITDRTTATVSSESYGFLLPSAHLRYNFSTDDRMAISVARTVRNPSFSFLSPALLEAELGDNDFLGNPTLRPETAWGIDVGYERRIGRDGIAGVNVFYRDVSDLIEVFNTGVVGSEGPGTFVLSARNTGDGHVWGIEFDFSAPLTFVGLDNTGAFFNYSWIDSEVTDEFGERTFNDQAESILNIGFIQDLPSLNSKFGVTYRVQGDAFSRIVGEEVTTSYGADLEAFVEHRVSDSFVLRLTGSNLLDESKDEVFNKFTTIDDQRLRNFDEYEIESETSGPYFQLVGRYSF